MKRKTLLFSFLGAIVVLLAAVYFVWNKPHETVDDKKGIRITAEALAEKFEEDEQSANTTYLNQALEVSGIISEISQNQDGKDVILLESANPFSGVQCTLKEKISNHKEGDSITIKGFCHGYTLAVLLSDCIVMP